MKRRKPKDDAEKCENGIYTTHNVKTEIVINGLENESNVAMAMKDSQEDGTDSEVKTENVKTGLSEVTVEDSQNVSLNEHLHANVVEVGVIDVQS
jgi:hypothetical protein